MVLEKDHEEQIIGAVRKAASSMEYGEVRICFNKDASALDVTVETHERLRLKKRLDTEINAAIISA